MGHTLVLVAQLAIELADVTSAREPLTQALVLAEKLDDRHAVAQALEGVARIAVLEERVGSALQLGGAADRLRELIHIPLTPAERLVMERTMARARSALDRSAAEAAWSEGGNLSVPQMIELAVGAQSVDEPRVSTVLTVRETAVARLVARGLRNRQIGETLAIAPGTAQRHVENIRAKLKVHSRAEVAAWAARQNL
jgi:DNA-binding NarL/FixJ family response regulator